jgi:hypothetical protein
MLRNYKANLAAQNKSGKFDPIKELLIGKNQKLI